MERAGFWKAFYLYSKKKHMCQKWLLADLLLISRMEEEYNSTPGKTRNIGISAVVPLEASY